MRLAPLNRLKPSSKILYWPFQGGTSFVDLLCFCSVLCLLCLCAHLFICALWSPAGKGLTSWLSFVVSTVSLSLSHWYPGSGVVLDCIDSWSCTLTYFVSFDIKFTRLGFENACWITRPTLWYQQPFSKPCLVKASLAMSTSVLKALPGKLDIKRHSPSILYVMCLLQHVG